jgi:GAF domain-containing protein
MAEPARPTLTAIVAAAVESTGATAGWILERRDDDLVIVAASGGSPQWATSLIGRSTPVGSGTASLVVQSGQPVALQPGGGGLTDEISTDLLGRVPVSLVCVPCTTDEHALGALQLVDKAGGSGFGFDDVEVASVLGTIAGAALADAGTAAVDRPDPAKLGADLSRLADVDPARYQAVAVVIEALLA